MSIFDRLYKFISSECVRNPILYGFSSATTVSLSYFVIKGQGRKSRAIWLGVFAPVVIVTSSYCNYANFMAKLQAQQHKQAAQYQTLIEGTPQSLEKPNNFGRTL